ncbi:MAG TPA: glycosyltransferase, partial [Chloroflexota bacterium]
REQRLVRQQAVWAARACSAHIAVSHAVRDHIVQVTGDLGKVRVIPNVVDGVEFAPPAERRRVSDQVLFVGILRNSKGFDVLLRALPELRRERPSVRIKVVGDPFYRAYQQEADRLRQLATELGVSDCLEIVGGKSPAETARLMAESQVVVLPSRRESFGTVLIEALACGTPVVATRCGGPEDIVTPDVGRLVPSEDPQALAAALISVLDAPGQYPADDLRAYALTHFGAPVIAQRLANEYATLVGPAVRMNVQARLAATSS